MKNDEQRPLLNVNAVSIENTNTGETVLTWSHVFVECKQKVTCSNCFRRTEPDAPQLLLNDLSGIARPGKILAIMGTSGVGKTTLLKVLSGQDDIRTTVTKGDVMLDGHATTRTERLSGSAIGYVEQNELFVETMTLEEHLIFQVSFDLYSYVHIL